MGILLSLSRLSIIVSRCSEIEERVRKLRYVRFEKKKGRTYLAIFGNVVEIRCSLSAPGVSYVTDFLKLSEISIWLPWVTCKCHALIRL